MTKSLRSSPNQFGQTKTILDRPKLFWSHRRTRHKSLFWLSHTTFLILPLFRGKGRNPWKNLVGFLEDLKTPKGHFEINWPLGAAVQLGFFRWVFALTRAVTRLQAQRGEAVPPSPHHCAGDPTAPPPPCCLKIAAWVRCYSMACKHAWWLWFVYEPKRGC